MTVRVLVVEDEPIAAETHVAYVGRVPGFAAVGSASSLAEAVRVLETERDAGTPVDLLLLDLHLPDGHGLALLTRLRATGHWCDVVAVTSARDADVVRRAVAQGVALYLLKPFTFATFRAKLQRYAEYRGSLVSDGSEVVQDEIDRAFGTLRSPVSDALPKGMSPETLSRVTAAVRDTTGTEAGGASASEVAAATGTSRVTARRYLEHLAEQGALERRPRYGAGRPELEYRWRT
ncbi:response regulator [Nocardioides sp. CFH 31398]|uniref:response regulator n=1 Tax=Nocardioides sp. CFH 31398 TaxID=2919579 RepID=UPI001F0549DC|nr:response regulator [Nocardioides sp. CFH 31398]MCH1867516.1 response regulator [Nocardioides sp. CFH 31398]